MKIVATSYINSSNYTEPEAWLKRINFYTGVYEAMAVHHELISIEQINYEGFRMINGVNYHFKNYRKDKIYLPHKLHRYIKQLLPDIVLVHGLHFPAQVMQLRRYLPQHTTIIAQHHAERPFDGWRKLLQQKADECIDSYLFSSKEMADEWLAKKIIRDPQKVFSVIEGSSSFTPLDKIAAGRKLGVTGAPVYLWVGRLQPNKDPLTVVTAFLKFTLIQPSAKLYMIFQTEELLEDIRSLINGTGHQSSIILVGSIPHQELDQWYSAADFFISGSQYEACGIAVTEAMSCGTIPILTNIPSFKNMTGNGAVGFLYDSGDVGQLLDILKQSLTLDIDAERQDVLHQFEGLLSFKAIASQFDSAFEKCKENALCK